MRFATLSILASALAASSIALGASAASAQSPFVVTVDAKNAETTFKAPGQDGRLTVIVSRDTRRIRLSSELPRGATLRWTTCAAVGIWMWDANIVSRDGKVTATATGQFEIPGPCEGLEQATATRSEALKFVGEGIRPDDDVFDKSCRAGSKATATGRASRWICAVKWLTPSGSRSCNSSYDVRKSDKLRYGAVVGEAWQSKRVTPIRCAGHRSSSRLLSEAEARAATSNVMQRELADDFGLADRMGSGFTLRFLDCERKSARYVKCLYVAKGEIGVSEAGRWLNCAIDVEVRKRAGAKKPTWRRDDPDCSMSSSV